MKLIKAVIFDLGRVLVDVNIRRLQEFFIEQACVEDIPQALNQIMANPVMAQFNTGHIGPQAFYQSLCADYRLSLSYEDFVFRWCDIFGPMDEMEKIIEALSQKVKLGLLSNTDPLHWGYIESHYPLMRYFHRPTLSFEVGVMKPHQAIYAAAAKHVQTVPAECLFVDDLDDNVRAARTAGMMAIRFEGVRQFGRELKRTGVF